MPTDNHNTLNPQQAVWLTADLSGINSKNRLQIESFYAIVAENAGKKIPYFRKEVYAVDATKALFKKIKGRDRKSFQLLTETYGWKLYSYIRRNTASRETADRIFSDTFIRFYDSMEEYGSDDPIETMLYLYADMVGNTPDDGSNSSLSRWQIAQETDFSLPEVRIPKKRRTGKACWVTFFYGVCIVLLLLGILAAFWILAWMLMDMNVVPRWDLGYSWFNTHIANWFLP